VRFIHINPKKLKFKNLRALLIIGILVLLSLSIFAVIFIKNTNLLTKEEAGKSSGIRSSAASPGNPVQDSPPNFQGIPKQFLSSEIVSRLPKDSIILLKFFTFEGDERVWQKNYIIKKSSVVEGTMEDPDIIIRLHSKYVNRFYYQDFCKVIKEAKNNDDAGFDAELSPVALAWKFKSLIEYKSCIT
jgi:hypothetical protein